MACPRATSSTSSTACSRPSVLPQTDRSPICLGKAGHYQDSGGPIHATLGNQALRSDHECPAPNRSVPDLFGKSRPLSRLWWADSRNAWEPSVAIGPLDRDQRRELGAVDQAAV